MLFRDVGKLNAILAYAVSLAVDNFVNVHSWLFEPVYDETNIFPADVDVLPLLEPLEVPYDVNATDVFATGQILYLPDDTCVIWKY